MTRSPLHNLVLFLICLALFGTIMAGVHYAVIDLPMQLANPAPMNDNLNDAGDCAKCMSLCSVKIWDSNCVKKCLKSCDCSPEGCPDR